MESADDVPSSSIGNVDGASSSSPVDGIYFTFIHANGINHRLASTERQLLVSSFKSDECHRALVLFLHGFPESWYSWRHQLLHLRRTPFLAVAPDMRGYGSTSKPVSVEAYTQPELAKDVIGIAAALGHDQFILVGHDWGSQLAWSVSLLYPHKVLGVCGMSVPHAGIPKAGLLTMLQAKYGRCLVDGDGSLTEEELGSARFHYILHHCLPRCAEMYQKNTSELFYRLYGATTIQQQIDNKHHDEGMGGLMFPSFSSLTAAAKENFAADAAAAPGLWARLPRPAALPAWLARRDLDYCVREFEGSGFHGPLCWYRALDRNAQLMAGCVADGKVRTPALFVMGANDANMLDLYGGRERLISRLKHSVPNLVREPIVLTDCGHWVNQERPTFVNNALLDFFRQVTSIRSKI